MLVTSFTKHRRVATFGAIAALVRETIDYDFGNNDRHGILRNFPGYGIEGGDEQEVVSDVRVRSASAPAEFELTDDPHAEIKVDDPRTEVSGPHRYVLEYTITGAWRSGCRGSRSPPYSVARSRCS